jgi:hypothetical protein
MDSKEVAIANPERKKHPQMSEANLMLESLGGFVEELPIDRGGIACGASKFRTLFHK